MAGFPGRGHCHPANAASRPLTVPRPDGPAGKTRRSRVSQEAHVSGKPIRQIREKRSNAEVQVQNRYSDSHNHVEDVRDTEGWEGGGINADLQVFAGRTIDQPSLFIAGAQDWGIHQRPGALERMEARACTDLRGLHLLAGAGHWVQQEKSAEVNRLVLEFLLAL